MPISAATRRKRIRERKEAELRAILNYHADSDTDDDSGDDQLFPKVAKPARVQDPVAQVQDAVVQVQENEFFNSSDNSMSHGSTERNGSDAPKSEEEGAQANVRDHGDEAGPSNMVVGAFDNAESNSGEEYLQPFADLLVPSSSAAEEDVEEQQPEEVSAADMIKNLRQDIRHWGDALVNTCLHHQVSVEGADAILNHVFDNLNLLHDHVHIIGRLPPRYKSLRVACLKKLPEVLTSVGFVNVSDPVARGSVLGPRLHVIEERNLNAYPTGYDNRHVFKRLWQETYVKLEDVIQLHLSLSDKHTLHDVAGGTFSVDGVQEFASGGQSIDVYSVRFRNCKNVYHVRSFRKDRPLTPREENVVDGNRPLRDLVADIVATLPEQMDDMINDAPKRAQVRGQKQHNGYYSCDYCLARGVTVRTQNQGKSLVCWPYKDCINVPMRTNEQSRDVANPAPGMIAPSPLLQLDPDKFDMVHDIPAEMMHTLSGVVKRMFELCYSTPGGRKGQLRKVPLGRLSGATRNVQVPSDFSRRARDINYGDYKQSEWRNLILFYVTLVVAPLDKRLQRLWLHLSFLVKACYQPQEEYEHVTVDLDKLQSTWYESFTQLMGDNQCSYVVHQVGAHLHSCVRKKGPLTNTTAFSFEYAYSKMRRRFHGTNNTLKQLMTNSLLEHTTASDKAHHCKTGVRYDPWKTSTAHNCYVYTYEQGKYVFYHILAQHEEQDSFSARKFSMTHFKHAAARLPFQEVGMFKRTAVTDGTHRLIKARIKGKVILFKDVMIAVPANILRET